ncbi:hypothetical protein EsDP_00002667 [Epichloe bromicola]|uniref:Serine hydrolase domain-containing protein n=1 Tax=Epichloe bromicola TaxID=79588 RepID=A0ABQ0CLH4_9HYPO
MTILCLHGAYGNASHFRTQLEPFIAEVQQAGPEQFKWINGGHTAIPPPGFEEYFGPGPLYRFVDYDGVTEFDNLLAKLREFPAGATAEDTIRKLFDDQVPFPAQPVKSTLDSLIQLLDDDAEITGILGYSEGAAVAASLILEEKRRFEEEGLLKNAIFFAGWPPVRCAGDEVEMLLADECEIVIDVPTCHVVGCNDPYLDGAMALFSMCDEDSALLFDHGKGHTVPRDRRTLQELASVINEWTPRQIMV